MAFKNNVHVEIYSMMHAPIKWSLWKILVFSLILIFFGISIASKMPLPAAEDLPREISNGQMVLQGQFKVLTTNFYSYTEPNQPFANHHWLSGVVFYLLHQAAGWGGMVVFEVIFVLLYFSLLFYITVKRGDFWLTAFFAVPTVIILISRSFVRPEIFSYFFIIVFLYLLFDFEENPGSKKIYWLIPLQLLWVNMHLYFAIGALMVGGFLFEKMVLNLKNLKRNPYIKKLSIIFCGLIVVCFINPYGLSGAVYALKVNTDPHFPISPAELISLPDYSHFMPLSQNLSAMLFEILSVLLLTSFIWAVIFRSMRKEPIFSNNIIFYFLAGIGTIGISYYIMRSIPLFGIIFLPAICDNLKGSYGELKTQLWRAFPHLDGFLKKVFIILFVGVLLYAIFFFSYTLNSADARGFGITAQSESSERFFKDNNLTGPIFNDTDIGSYLIYYLYPQERVFTDNRFGDAYSANFFGNIYLPMVRNEDAWQSGLKKYGFNVLFFYHYDDVDGMRDFIHRRMHDPEWVWVYADDYAVILVRNIPENQTIIDKYKIDDQNIVDRLSYLSQVPGSNDQLASADLFNLYGEHQLAINGYMEFAAVHPDAGKVWFALGSSELNKADEENPNSYLALLALSRAISVGWKTPDAYSYLTLAYYRLGEYDLARQAVREELKIDPQSEDGYKWMSILSDPGLK